MVIHCEHLVKIYETTQSFRALDDVSLNIKKGDFVSIMGPSGCGKSTLLNILGLLDEPISGEYLLNGVKTAHMKDFVRSRLRCNNIGFVFQSFNLMPKLSVLQNNAHPKRYNIHNPPKENLPPARQQLPRGGLEQKAENTPLQLSGGQCQRVACARALANRPEIILADEPTGNLDSKSGAEILNLLQELNQNGLTIIMVTHDEKIAAGARSIICMKDGKIL